MNELRALIQRYGQLDGQIAWDCRFAGYQVERALVQLDMARGDLDGAVARYRDAEKAWLASNRGLVGARILSADDVAIRDEYETVLDVLPFRMEVYITQARVVLDRVARLVHFALRPASIEIGSHSSMNQLPQLAAEHSVVVPTSLTERIDALTRDVKNLRDRFIVHPHGPRGHLIRRVARVEDSGEVRLRIKWAPPTREDFDAGLEGAVVSSADFSSLDAAVRDYVREVVALIETGRPLT